MNIAKNKKGKLKISDITFLCKKRESRANLIETKSWVRTQHEELHLGLTHYFCKNLG